MPIIPLKGILLFNSVVSLKKQPDRRIPRDGFVGGLSPELDFLLHTCAWHSLFTGVSQDVYSHHMGRGRGGPKQFFMGCTGVFNFLNNYVICCDIHSPINVINISHITTVRIGARGAIFPF